MSENQDGQDHKRDHELCGSYNAGVMAVIDQLEEAKSKRLWILVVILGLTAITTALHALATGQIP